MRTADLSIILSNYNHAQFLPRSIAALLSQTVRPREIILVDDASTDNSLAVMESYAKNEPSVRIVRNPRNLGVNASFNNAVKDAKGAYIAAAAADDYVMPTWVEKSMATLEMYPQAGLSCSYHSTVSESTGEISANASQWCKEPTYFSPERLADFIGILSIASSSAIYKRSSLFKAGCYLPDLKWYSDWFLNLVIAYRDGIVHIPETLSLVTVQAVSYSAGRKRDQEDHIAVVSRLIERVLSPEFEDVATWFRRSGTLAGLGTDLIRAAVRRPDYRDFAMLSLVNGFTREEYEEFIADPDPKVRELAIFLLGRQWKVRNEREQLMYLEHLMQMAVRERDQARRERDQALHERNEAWMDRNIKVDRIKAELQWLRSSKFWQIRNAVVGFKRRVGKLLGRKAGPQPFSN